MNGKFIYYAGASLLGVLCSLESFPVFFFLALLYFWIIYACKQFNPLQLKCLLSAFLIFFISSQFVLQHNKTKIPASISHFNLQYLDNPVIDGNQLQITARDAKTGEKLLLRYQITSEQEKKKLENSNFYGCLCQVSGSLGLPQQAKNENSFNYREYLKQQHIFWIVDSREMPLSNCQKQKMNGLTFLKQLRFYGINELRRDYPPEVAAVSAALIYGDRSLMSPDLLTYYQKIGLTHLLAISGLHVSLLIWMIFYLGIRLGATREFMNKFLLLILPAYAVLTGGSPSVVRSVLMIFLVLLTVKWKRSLKLLPADAISITFMFLLLINPLIIFDVGFQLSFIVSFAIIVSSTRILQRNDNIFMQMLFVSIVAQLASLPFMLYHFFSVNLISLFANLVFIPLYSYLFLPGVYILLFIQLFLGSIPDPFLNVFAKIVQLSTDLSQTLSTISFSQFTPGRPVPLLLLFYSAVITTIFLFWERKYLKRKKYILMSLFFLLFGLQLTLNKLDRTGNVEVIDVGQGDSIFIQLPFEKGNYLIDTGGILSFQMQNWQQRTKVFEPGRDIVVPFLKGKGITQLDKLILTHGDEDHIGGALSIMREIKIKQILLPAVKETSASEAAIIKEADKKGIPIVYVSEGQQWKTEESQFYILSPEKSFSGDRNRGSLTILARIGGLNWFFGGDMDQAGEEEIAKKYPEIAIDVLKVGHHGSRTSSSPVFLNQYKPKAALISVGEKNRFGHPHQEVIDNLKRAGTKIFRTDLQGEIIYRFFRDRGTFSTYLP